MLPAIGLAQFEASDWRWHTTRWLAQTGRSADSFPALAAERGWIDAGGAEKQQLCAAGTTRRLDHIRRDRQAVGQEIGGVGVVRMGAANPRRGEQHRVRPVLIEPVTDCGPIAQINRTTFSGEVFLLCF